MDTKELTKKYYEMRYKVDDLEKKVSFLEQECEKQRMFIEDMKIDIQMLQHSKRSVRTE